MVPSRNVPSGGHKTVTRCLSGHVRFIDYEYSSYNYQAFDIGNHFNEFAGLLKHTCDRVLL